MVLLKMLDQSREKNVARMTTKTMTNRLGYLIHPFISSIHCSHVQSGDKKDNNKCSEIKTLYSTRWKRSARSCCQELLKKQLSNALSSKVAQWRWTMVMNWMENYLQSNRRFLRICFTNSWKLIYLYTKFHKNRNICFQVIVLMDTYIFKNFNGVFGL